MREKTTLLELNLGFKTIFLLRLKIPENTNAENLEKKLFIYDL